MLQHNTGTYAAAAANKDLQRECPIFAPVWSPGLLAAVGVTDAHEAREKTSSDVGVRKIASTEAPP